MTEKTLKQCGNCAHYERTMYHSHHGICQKSVGLRLVSCGHCCDDFEKMESNNNEMLKEIIEMVKEMKKDLVEIGGLLKNETIIIDRYKIVRPSNQEN